MWPFSLMQRWQRKRRRAIDRAVLFPAIRAQQKSKAQGDKAIVLHIQGDPAWQQEEEWWEEGIEKDDACM